MAAPLLVADTDPVPRHARPLSRGAPRAGSRALVVLGGASAGDRPPVGWLLLPEEGGAVRGGMLVLPLEAVVWQLEVDSRGGAATSPGPEVAELEPGEEAVVALLASGQKTDTIARRLGVSRRTVERRLATLRRRYRAASNVQLVAIVAPRLPHCGTGG